MILNPFDSKTAGFTTLGKILNYCPFITINILILLILIFITRYFIIHKAYKKDPNCKLAKKNLHITLYSNIIVILTIFTITIAVPCIAYIQNKVTVLTKIELNMHDILVDDINIDNTLHCKTTSTNAIPLSYDNSQKIFTYTDKNHKIISIIPIYEMNSKDYMSHTAQYTDIKHIDNKYAVYINNDLNEPIFKFTTFTYSKSTKLQNMQGSETVTWIEMNSDDYLTYAGITTTNNN